MDFKFIIVYILPAIISWMILPKALSMDSINYRCYKSSLVKWKHLFLPFILGLIPMLNILAAIFSISLVVTVLIDVSNVNGSWLNKPIFERKRKE